MNAQMERDVFWNYFDKYIKEKGDEFYVAHVKQGKNQAAGNINNNSPMAMQTICCEYKYREQSILVQVYLNDNQRLFDYLHERKELIEKELGYKVEWIVGGKISTSVRRIQKKFYINKPIESMVKEIYPYILDFIRVFKRYL